MQHRLAAVEVLDEFGDTAGILEIVALGFAGFRVGCALVSERDLESLVQERELAQSLRKRVEVVLGGGEDLFIGKKMDLGAALFCVACLL